MIITPLLVPHGARLQGRSVVARRPDRGDRPSVAQASTSRYPAAQEELCPVGLREIVGAKRGHNTEEECETCGRWRIVGLNSCRYGGV
jgi:hypothetical protein